MTYAKVENGQVTEPVTLPDGARRLDTGQWVLGLPTAPVDVQQAAGYYEVVETEPTVGDATHVPVRTVSLVAGVPTEVWTTRVKTAPELAQDLRNDNMQALITKGRAAFAANTTFLAIASPTAAQVRDQVQLLTREMNGMFKMVLARYGQGDMFDDTTGT